MRSALLLVLLVAPVLAGCASPGSFEELPARPYVAVSGERRSLANASVELGEDVFVVDLVGMRSAVAQAFEVRATHAAGSQWRVSFRSVDVSGPAGSGALEGEARVADGVLVVDVPFTPSADAGGIAQMKADIRLATRHGGAPGQDAVFVLPFFLT